MCINNLSPLTKVCFWLVENGLSVLIAAGDTFRYKHAYCWSVLITLYFFFCSKSSFSKDRYYVLTHDSNHIHTSNHIESDIFSSSFYQKTYDSTYASCFFNNDWNIFRIILKLYLSSNSITNRNTILALIQSILIFFASYLWRSSTKST